MLQPSIKVESWKLPAKINNYYKLIAGCRTFDSKPLIKPCVAWDKAGYFILTMCTLEYSPPNKETEFPASCITLRVQSLIERSHFYIEPYLPSMYHCKYNR